MAVKISGLKPTVTCPAQLFLAGDNGERVLHKFSVHFKRTTTEERNALNERYIKGDLVTDAETGKASYVPITTSELLNEVVVDWGGMLDEAGHPVPYSAQVRADTDNEFPGVEQAMAVSWFDHMFINQRDASVKNSKAPSAITSAPTTRTAA